MFGSIGYADSIVILVGAWLVWFAFSLVKTVRGGSGPTLVLTRFAINDAPGAPVVVEIAGRASGIVGWMLGLLRLGAETSLLVTDRQIVFRTGGLFGEIHHVIPASSVASTHCGITKPLWAFVTFLLFTLLALLSLLTLASNYTPGAFGSSDILAAGLLGVMLNLIISFCLLAFYFFRRKLTIAIESDGGLLAGLSFKRGIVENISVDLPQTIAAIKAINLRVLNARK
jgi:hypothetical protein